VAPVRLPSHALAQEARALEMAESALVEPVHLELNSVVVEVEDQYWTRSRVAAVPSPR
jgi:hypothetical protein